MNLLTLNWPTFTYYMVIDALNSPSGRMFLSNRDPNLRTAGDAVLREISKFIGCGHHIQQPAAANLCSKNYAYLLNAATFFAAAFFLFFSFLL